MKEGIVLLAEQSIDLLDRFGAGGSLMLTMGRGDDLETDETAKTAPRQTHSDRVFEAIETAIVSGEIALGERLGEVGLGKRFGVSRGPLREALRQLEGRGLVTRLPHAGVRVVSLSKSELMELYEIRAVMEGLACRLAADRITGTEITTLEELLNRQRHLEDLQNDTAFSQEYGDLDFHYLIAQYAKSPRLERLLCRDLYSIIRLVRYRTSHTPGRAIRSFHDHEDILGALRRRDGELAEILMRRHIAAARAFIMAGPDFKTRD